MVKPIPQYGKTVRLTKETLEGLLVYDSDPNHAFLKMKAAIETNRAMDLLPAQNQTPALQYLPGPHPCKFDEGTVIKTIQEAIRTTLESFR